MDHAPAVHPAIRSPGCGPRVAAAIPPANGAPGVEGCSGWLGKGQGASQCRHHSTRCTQHTRTVPVTGGRPLRTLPLMTTQAPHTRPWGSTHTHTHTYQARPVMVEEGGNGGEGPGPACWVTVPVCTTPGYGFLRSVPPGAPFSMQHTPPTVQHEFPTQVLLGWGELKEYATQVAVAQQRAWQAARVDPGLDRKSFPHRATSGASAVTLQAARGPEPR